jgi:hypothetical protein
MKSLRLFHLLFALPLFGLAQGTVPLSNKHVILLVESGLRPSEVVRLIGAAPAVSFDLTPTGTEQLLRAGVSEETIKQMAAREILGKFYATDIPRTTPLRRRAAFHSDPSGADRGPVDDASREVPGAFVLRSGTRIRMRLNRNLSSADARTGDIVYFEVLDEVKALPPYPPYVVINRGASAFGTIIDAQEKRRLGRAGRLQIRVDFVRLADGDELALRDGDQKFQGHGHQGAMVGAMVATAAVYAPAAPLFLFIHGRDITADEGREFYPVTNGDANLDGRDF